MILNASTEPLTFVSVKRAMLLVLKDKAEIVEAHAQRRIHSEKESYPYPLVIRLLAYVRIPRRFRGIVTNPLLFARDNFTCQYCGRHKSRLRKKERLTREHVKPISRGGADSWDNVTTACSTCNHSKGSRLPYEAHMYPKTTPFAPRYIAIVLISQVKNPQQKRYIEPFIKGR
ncbi:MAG: HNH endonuclease [Actinobacteria bacterium]|nr:MAG: HNH endonuclease [Actinomycetota bacterium]